MTSPKSLTKTEIEQLIPHRDPFLWLDEVGELTETGIKARKYLPESLPVFAGHYPTFPIFPGVLQCEAAFQAGAVLIAQTMTDMGENVPVVTRLNNVQFRKMIRPGQTMELEVELTERVGNAFFLKGKVMVDGQVSVRLEFACAAANPMS